MHVKKLSTIAIFVAGVVLVFTLILTRNFFKTTIAKGDTTQNLVVYADQLAGQFSNWSWGSSVNLSNTSPVYTGASSIRFTPQAWGALYFHSQSLITTAAYTSLQFTYQSSEQKTNFSVIFYDNTNQSVKAVNLAPYVSSGKNGWMTVTIPA